MQELRQARSVSRKKTDDLAPSAEAIKRFLRTFGPLAKEDETVGLAVSGGPDSLALLLLAAAARPGKVEAASVDHGLREGSREEAEMVAGLCERLGVRHEILTIDWEKKPTSAIQERARHRRYKALAQWAIARGIALIATAHHADDQAETLLMRLARGSGVRGLGGMHPVSNLPGSELTLARPLLRWRRAELADICTRAGIEPAADPSNADTRFERVRVRQMLDHADGFDAQMLAKSADLIGQADQALRWSAMQEWSKRVTEESAVITFDPATLPREICRRIVLGIVMKLATEGKGEEPRGREVDEVMRALVQGKRTTLRGVLCGGGRVWRFARAPERRAANG